MVWVERATGPCGRATSPAGQFREVERVHRDAKLSVKRPNLGTLRELLPGRLVPTMMVNMQGSWETVGLQIKGGGFDLAGFADCFCAPM